MQRGSQAQATGIAAAIAVGRFQLFQAVSQMTVRTEQPQGLDARVNRAGSWPGRRGCAPSQRQHMRRACAPRGAPVVTA